MYKFKNKINKKQSNTISPMISKKYIVNKFIDLTPRSEVPFVGKKLLPIYYNYDKDKIMH